MRFDLVGRAGVFIAAIDVGQRGIHEDGQITERRTFRCGGLQTRRHFRDQLRMLRSDVGLFMRIAGDVEEFLADELEVAFAQRGQTHAAGDFDDDFITRARLALQHHAAHVHAVERQLLLQGASGQGDKGGQQVGDVHHRIVRRARFDLAGPAGDEGHANAAFKSGVFRSTPGFVHLFGQAAVVVGEDDERVVGEALLLDRFEDASHAFVEALDGGGAFFQFRRVARDVLQRAVDGVEGDVVEERLVLRFPPDQIHRLLGDEISRVACFEHRLLIAMPVIDREDGGRVVRDGLVVVVDAPGVVAVLMIEALAHRQLFRQPLAEMPLARHRSGVTRLLQRLGHRALFSGQTHHATRRCAVGQIRQLHAEQRQVVRLAEVLRAPVHPLPIRIASRHQRRACRGADGRHVKLREARPLCGQLVDVRRQLAVTAIEARIRPAEVVGHDEDDVRRRRES